LCEQTQLLLTVCVLRWPNLYGGHSQYFLTRPLLYLSFTGSVQAHRPIREQLSEPQRSNVLDLSLCHHRTYIVNDASPLSQKAVGRPASSSMVALARPTVYLFICFKLSGLPNGVESVSFLPSSIIHHPSSISPSSQPLSTYRNVIRTPA